MSINIENKKTGTLAKLLAVGLVAGWTTVSFVGCSKESKVDEPEETPAAPEAVVTTTPADIPAIEAPAPRSAEPEETPEVKETPAPTHNNPQTTISRPSYPLPDAPLSELGVEDMAIRALQSDKPAEKIEIIRAMRDVDSEETITNLLRILGQEQDPRVRAEVLQSLMKSNGLEGKMAIDTAGEVRRSMESDSSPEMLVNGSELLANVADPSSVQYLKETFTAPNSDNILKTVVAAKGLNRIHQNNPELVTAAEVEQYNTRLKEIYQSNDTQVVRFQAVQGLAQGKQIDTLKEMWANEQDPKMKSLISRTLVSTGIDPGELGGSSAPAAPQE